MPWNPKTYARFSDLRLRPAIDLLQAVGGLPAGGVVDLGCGAGAMAAPLASLGRSLTGVDSSPEMLEQAQEGGAYTALELADIASWSPASLTEPPALVFSNAALQWLPDHAALLPRLAGLLAPQGCLAVQVPHQNQAPSHRCWMDLMAQRYPGRIDLAAGPGVLEPQEYHRILAPLGRVSIWETEYFQQLADQGTGHPVRLFTESTFARPLLAVLQPEERADLIAAYEAQMARAYPRQADGSVLFPFRRLFFTLHRG